MLRVEVRRGEVYCLPVSENSLMGSPHRNGAPAAKSGAGFRSGLACGISAYTLWGVFPLYFRAVSAVSPPAILCHRVLWSSLFLGLLISWRREWHLIRAVASRRRNLLLLSAGAVLIAANWLIFIYAVTTRQVLQASLGYFINPLLSIALGMLFLGERLRRLQWLAVLTACGAVANIALRGGGFPWIAVSLAVTFAFYGLVRKKLNINSLHGLLVETALLIPFAAAGLLWLPATSASTGVLGLLALSGPITAIPLLLFGAAVRQLPLSMIGFLQYIGPSLQFLIAVRLLSEALDKTRLASFVLCWIAIAIYILDSILARRPQEVSDEPE